jgi:O-antigen ligase
LTRVHAKTDSRRLDLRLWSLVLRYPDEAAFAAYLGLLATFFLVEPPWRRTLSHFALLPTVFILADRGLVRAIVRDRLFLTVFAWGAYLAVVTFVCGPPELFRALDMVRNAVLVLCFVCITAYLAAQRDAFVADISKVVLPTATVASVISIALFINSGEERLVPVAMGGELLDGTMMYGGAIAVSAMFLYRFERDGWRRLASVVVCVAVIFLLLTLAQARGAMIALLIVAVVLALLTRGSVGAVVALIVLVAAIGIAFMDVSALYTRLDSYRLMIWSEAIRIAGERPIFGFGTTARVVFATLPDGQSIFDPHSIFIANQLYGGLIGSALLAAVLVVFAHDALRIFRQTGDASAIAIMAFGLVNGLTHGYTLFTGANHFWLVFFLPIGLVIGARLRLNR